MSENEFGIGVDDAASELAALIDDGVDFLRSEYSDDWARAERYYAGGTDLPSEVGRSQVVKTEVRDTIRGIKPSVMRTLLHARKIIEYIPSTIHSSEYAEQQSVYATQLFWKNDGYKVLLSSFDESAKKKIGPIKTYWEQDPTPEFFTATHIDAQQVKVLDEAPDVEIEDIEVIPSGGEDRYNVKCRKYYENGRIRMEAFPAVEFFINRNATGIHDARVHGHRRDVLVSEALEMGLEYDDWMSLDSDDPEQNDFEGESYERRGYQKHQGDDMDSDDLANHKFLLTECYCEYDLEGDGRLRKYLFYFGGSGYQYLHHEEIDDYCIDLVEIDPVPFTPLGHSLYDLTNQEQDLNTSVLRAISDNFHMANNPRYAANPMLTDFADLMSNRIGTPIKNKQGGDIQVIDIPFTGQQGLPFLQYLEADVQNKVGVTKAAQGLDPDAMQSTDKDAVRNTIMLAQGQVELIVRNIIETALVPVFKRLLKLSTRHMDRLQVIRIKGMTVPIDQVLIDPDLAAEPNVGLGTTQPDQKMQGLMFILDRQEKTMQTMGFDNPFVSLTNIYNTLEDITELSGFHDVGRYFKLVTPEIEAKIAEQRAEAAQKQADMEEANQPTDPAKAMMTIESGKARIKMAEITADREKNAKQLELEAIKLQEQTDLERDKLAQDRIIELLKVREGSAAKAADTRIKREQMRNNRVGMNGQSVSKGTETGS